MTTGKEEDKQKAYQIFSKMATNEDMSEKERDILTAMGNPNAPNRRAMDKQIGEMGKITQANRRLSTARTMQRRLIRLNKAMGDNREEIIDRLNRVQTAGKGLGQRFQDMLARGEALTPEDMKREVQAAAQAGLEGKKEDVESVMAILADLPGGEFLSTAVRAGYETRVVAEQLTGKGSRKNKAGLLNALMRGITGRSDITSSDIREIQRGNMEKVEGKVLKGLDVNEKKHAQELLNAVKDKDISKIMEIGLKGAQIRAMGGIARKLEDSVLAQARIGTDDVAGRLGSRQGMHAEMSAMRKLLEQIAKSDAINAPGLGNPTNTQGKKDHQAK